LSDLRREIELKHLKNEKLDQELEPKRLKKEQNTPKSGQWRLGTYGHWSICTHGE
jgi:hypothetical protein